MHKLVQEEEKGMKMSIIIAGLYGYFKENVE